MTTARDIFEAMKSRIQANPAKVTNLSASYQFELTGDGGGTFHANFESGAFDIGEGALPNPGCTVSLAAADFVALAEGKLNPTAAFMTGKLKIKGDMAMAMKLQAVLS